MKDNIAQLNSHVWFTTGINTVNKSKGASLTQNQKFMFYVKNCFNCSRVAGGWPSVCHRHSPYDLSLYIHMTHVFIDLLSDNIVIRQKARSHDLKGDYSVVLMFKHSADTHNIHWIISHSKCRFRSYCTWTGTSSKGLLGPEETYRWSFDSTATL